MEKNAERWSLVLKPKSVWWDLDFHSLWKSRDLIGMFVWRDFISQYKQTVLGPLWFLIQPVISTIVFTIIFGRIAKIPTDGLPQVLFYMCGIVGWNYFADCFTKTSNTFVANAGIFGKVYFPRLVVPLSIIISNLAKFLVQFLLFIGFLFFYFSKGAQIHPNIYMLLTPFLLLIMAGLGLGLGIIISSLTTKYRDLQQLVVFGTQLLMYLTPVVYPLSFISGKMKLLFLANPMTAIIETFKFAFLGTGEFNWANLSYSAGFMLIVLLIGIFIFNKVEKSFMDTV
ncbi:MAG: ABC transporter permease [Bacteroidetes bacterium]|nr:ABC transporter permease [Bacteroidota bacterium]